MARGSYSQKMPTFNNVALSSFAKSKGSVTKNMFGKAVVAKSKSPLAGISLATSLKVDKLKATK